MTDSTNTQGVGVEAVAWRRFEADRPDLWSIVPEIDVEFLQGRGAHIEPLYGPQAAQRIEELEAENARLEAATLDWIRQFADADNAYLAACARAIKAERQRDEVVGMLSDLFEEGPLRFVIAGNPIVADRWTDRARSVLLSIKEG